MIFIYACHFFNRCKRQCLTILAPHTTESLLRNFNNIGDKNCQDTYLQGLMRTSKIKRRKVKGQEVQKYNFHYEVNIRTMLYLQLNPTQASYRAKINYLLLQIKTGGISHIVCREAFASLHGVSVKRIRRIGELLTSNKSPKDLRGRHNNRPRAKSDIIIQTIDEHIRSFPFCVSHHGPCGRKKRYLAPNLNVLKMYTLYLQKYYPDIYLTLRTPYKDAKNVKCDVQYHFYKKYFKDKFNYSFGRPASDVCTICQKLEASLRSANADIRTLEIDLQVHKAKAKVFFIER